MLTRRTFTQSNIAVFPSKLPLACGWSLSHQLSRFGVGKMHNPIALEINFKWNRVCLSCWQFSSLAVVNLLRSARVSLGPGVPRKKANCAWAFFQSGGREESFRSLPLRQFFFFFNSFRCVIGESVCAQFLCESINKIARLFNRRETAPWFFIENFCLMGKKDKHDAILAVATSVLAKSSHWPVMVLTDQSDHLSV